MLLPVSLLHTSKISIYNKKTQNLLKTVCLGFLYNNSIAEIILFLFVNKTVKSGLTVNVSTTRGHQFHDVWNEMHGSFKEVLMVYRTFVNHFASLQSDMWYISIMHSVYSTMMHHNKTDNTIHHIHNTYAHIYAFCLIWHKSMVWAVLLLYNIQVHYK